MKTKEWEQFANSLGITTAKTSGSSWYDFEEFLIDGIIIADTSSRLFTSLYFVFQNSINIISPNKLFKVAKIFFTKDKEWKILGLFVESSLINTRSKTQWTNFLVKVKGKFSRKSEPLFKVKSFRKNKKFSIWFLESGALEFDSLDKYLNCSIFFKHPLIRSRLLGTKLVYSDLLYFKSFNRGKDYSLRELSRFIHHDPAQICDAVQNLNLVNGDT
jgi:hypothetical protein